MVADEAKAALLGQELKLKSSSLIVGFNAPEHPQTTIKVNLSVGGQEALHKANELREKYHDAVNAKKEQARFSGWRAENDDHFFVEIKITIEAGNAKEYVYIL